ncbi:unnamed protein product [Absidia cylindrospora]
MSDFLFQKRQGPLLREDYSEPSLSAHSGMATSSIGGGDGTSTNYSAMDDDNGSRVDSMFSSIQSTIPTLGLIQILLLLCVQFDWMVVLYIVREVVLRLLLNVVPLHNQQQMIIRQLPELQRPIMKLQQLPQIQVTMWYHHQMKDSIKLLKKWLMNMDFQTM